MAGGDRCEQPGKMTQGQRSLSEKALFVPHSLNPRILLRVRTAVPLLLLAIRLRATASCSAGQLGLVRFSSALSLGFGLRSFANLREPGL